MHDGGAAATVLDLERQRFADMLRGDISALRSKFDEELSYVHSNGAVDDKASYLEAVESGHIHYVGLTPSEQRLTELDEVAFIDGKLRLDALVGGEPRRGVSQTLSVWAKRGSDWRLIRWHATPIL